MRTWLPTIVCLACLVAGCSGDSVFEGECRRDSDCDQYERCDELDYRCVCASDEACAQGEYCNASGSCQRKTSCYSNEDCPQGNFCDVVSGACIASDSCTRDTHCDIGQICLNGFCRLGCRDTADCDLMLREVCVEGTCRLGLCENNDYCDFGRVCNPITLGCEVPPDPHCQPDCSRTCEGCTDPDQGPCGDPANVCGGTAGDTHCWVACSGPDDCPSGYQCVPTSVSWSPFCDQATDCTEAPNPNDRVINVCDGEGDAARCRLNKQPCATDADCHPFEISCLANQCIFGYHCRPPGGCL